MEPTTLSDALEALASARADLSALDVLSNEHKASLEALAQAKCDNSTLVLAIANLQNEKAALEASLQAVKAAEADANAKAVEIVASLGVEPVAVVPETVSAKQSLAERLEGVTDPRERGKIRAEFLNSQK